MSGRPNSPCYKPGIHNAGWKAFCDRCGRLRSSTQLTTDWMNLKVCETCWEPKPWAYYVKAIPDFPAVPWSRPNGGVPTENAVAPFDPATNMSPGGDGN